MNPATTQRLSAAERKDEILEAAMIEFAERGLHGTSTEDIARRAGISQPYLFRLFRTKKELYKASVRRCMTATLELMQTAAAGHSGEAALRAIGTAYVDRLRDPLYLRAQMQAYAGQGQFPGADRVYERALALPFHTQLTEDELDRVVDALAPFA